MISTVTPQATVAPSDVIVDQLPAKTEGNAAATTDLPLRISPTSNMNSSEITVHASDLSTPTEVNIILAPKSPIYSPSDVDLVFSPASVIYCAPISTSASPSITLVADSAFSVVVNTVEA